MALEHRSYGSARVVTPGGRLDHDNCDAFQSDLAAELDACSRDSAALVLDMSTTAYVSSAGLRCLMIAARQESWRSSRGGGSAPEAVVAEILRIRRLNLGPPVFATTR